MLKQFQLGESVYQERKGGCWKRIVNGHTSEADATLCEAYYTLIQASGSLNSVQGINPGH